MTKRKLFLVSNMYPSKEHIRYGIFVKNFEKAVENDYDVRRSVLTKRTTNVSKLFGYLGLYVHILTLVYKVKKDEIIYVHFPLHLAPALWFVQIFKKNIVLNFHGSDLIFKNVFTKFLSVFLNPLVKKSFIVVPSNYYKSKIVTTYSIEPTKVFVYPSGGINTSVFYPKRNQKKDIFVLGFVSNFIESKGWEVFLLAVKNIVKNKCIPNVELIMIGEGPDRQKINNVLEDLDVTYKIIPSVSQQELASFYNTFNLFVFPTYREALGLVGLEAMACGTPVVAGRVGGPMSYIKDGSNSYLFSKKDANDLEKKIIHYYNLSEPHKKKVRTEGISTAKLYDYQLVNRNLLLFLKGLE